VQRFTPPQQHSLWLAPVLCLLMAGVAWGYENRPYKDMVAHYSSSMVERSAAQKANIRAAAQRLDGAVVGPGEQCSFNALVGPRTTERGFVPANAFMEGTLTRSLGGGVCQVSSTLYAAVQETSLEVVQRHAHHTIVSSVPPGRDATVWYGKADFVWKNTLDRPVKIRALVDDTRLRIELWGSARPTQQAALRFLYRYGAHQQRRVVAVYRRVDGRNTLLSTDVYKLH
jgi:vancomycin resistance protein YoaR